MKKIFQRKRIHLNKILLVIAALIGHCYGYAQPRFHFIAPAATINSFAGHANPTGIALPQGYDIVEITAANEAAFHAVAPEQLRNAYRQMQPGTPLRTRLNEVYQVSSGNVPVNYYLVDDRTGINNQRSGDFQVVTLPSSNGRYQVWPTGNGFALAEGGFQGRVRLGEHQMNFDQVTRPGGPNAIGELILHETFHTQLVGRWTKWNGYITYGADETHYISEILGDQEAPLNEAFGTFYGYTINTAGAARLEQFFTRTDNRYELEGASVAAGSPVLNSAPRIRHRIGENTYYQYRWLDVPGVFNLQNENNFTAFLYYFWLNANGSRDVTLQMLRDAANSVWSLEDTLKRYPTYMVNRIALRMEDYNSNGGRTDATKTSSMFPFALLDLVMHFGFTERQYRADYDRNYPDRHPRAYTEYFAHRDAIRQLVLADLNASPIRFTEAVRKIKEYCMQPNTIW